MGFVDIKGKIEELEKRSPSKEFVERQVAEAYNQVDEFEDDAVDLVRRIESSMPKIWLAFKIFGLVIVVARSKKNNTKGSV